MKLWGGGIAELLRFDARQSQNADVLQKFNNQSPSQNGPLRRCGLIARKNPLRVSIQLFIFRFYDTTGVIDVLLLRFGCQ